MTTHNTHNRQTSMPPAGLDLAATRTGTGSRIELRIQLDTEQCAEAYDPTNKS